MFSSTNPNRLLAYLLLLFCCSASTLQAQDFLPGLCKLRPTQQKHSFDLSKSLFATDSLLTDTLEEKFRGFRKGQVGVQVGIGFVVLSDYSKTDYSIYGTNEYVKSVPIGLRAYYGLSHWFSVGLGLTYHQEKVTIFDVTNPGNVYGINHTLTSIACTPMIHIPSKTTKFDPYIVGEFGATLVKADRFGDNNFVLQPLGNIFCWAARAGANCYFTKNAGAFLEVGYARWTPLMNLGLSLKF